MILFRDVVTYGNKIRNNTLAVGKIRVALKDDWK